MYKYYIDLDAGIEEKIERLDDIKDMLELIIEREYDPDYRFILTIGGVLICCKHLFTPYEKYLEGRY